MSEQESLLEFPCSFPIKAMGRNNEDFEAIISEIVFKHAEPVAAGQTTSRTSGSGNFLSVTVTINAQSKQQLDRIYEDLTACEKVLMAL
jgi:putative lipoic acid-binding regulatory protein